MFCGFMENKTLTHVRQKHLDLCWKGESAQLKTWLPHIYVPARGQVSHIYKHMWNIQSYLFCCCLLTDVKTLQPFNNKCFSTHTHHSTGRIMGLTIGVWDVLGK